jgi:hypothetical protein
MSFFFFYKIREQEGGTSPVWGGLVPEEGGEVMGKGSRKVNMV